MISYDGDASFLSRMERLNLKLLSHVVRGCLVLCFLPCFSFLFFGFLYKNNENMFDHIVFKSYFKKSVFWKEKKRRKERSMFLLFPVKKKNKHVSKKSKLLKLKQKNKLSPSLTPSMKSLFHLINSLNLTQPNSFYKVVASFWVLELWL